MNANSVPACRELLIVVPPAIVSDDGCRSVAVSWEKGVGSNLLHVSAHPLLLLLPPDTATTDCFGPPLFPHVLLFMVYVSVETEVVLRALALAALIGSLMDRVHTTHTLGLWILDWDLIGNLLGENKRGRGKKL